MLLCNTHIFKTIKTFNFQRVFSPRVPKNVGQRKINLQWIHPSSTTIIVQIPIHLTHVVYKGIKYLCLYKNLTHGSIFQLEKLEKITWYKKTEAAVFSYRDKVTDAFGNTGMLSLTSVTVIWTEVSWLYFCCVSASSTKTYDNRRSLRWKRCSESIIRQKAWV